MITKTLVSLVSIGMLCSLAACGEAPEDTPSPSATEPMVDQSTTSQTSLMTPSETSDATDSPDAPESPSSEPASSESASTDEIPSVIQGKWIFFAEGEKARGCTEELESEGAIITISPTKISSFASLSELESIKESDADSMVGLFDYHDDSDTLLTLEIKLVTQDDWKTLEYIELGTEAQDPAMYARCSQ